MFRHALSIAACLFFLKFFKAQLLKRATLSMALSINRRAHRKRRDCSLCFFFGRIRVRTGRGSRRHVNRSRRHFLYFVVFFFFFFSCADLCQLLRVLFVCRAATDSIGHALVIGHNSARKVSLKIAIKR